LLSNCACAVDAAKKEKSGQFAAVACRSTKCWSTSEHPEVHTSTITRRPFDLAGLPAGDERCGETARLRV